MAEDRLAWTLSSFVVEINIQTVRASNDALLRAGKLTSAKVNGSG